MFQQTSVDCLCSSRMGMFPLSNRMHHSFMLESFANIHMTQRPIAKFPCMGTMTILKQNSALGGKGVCYYQLSLGRYEVSSQAQDRSLTPKAIGLLVVSLSQSLSSIVDLL